MNVSMNIPDRLYSYLQQSLANEQEGMTLDDALSQAVSEIVERQFEERMNAMHVISHEQFMAIVRSANLDSKPRKDDEL